MITLLIGKKGSGKTKTMIDMINNATKSLQTKRFRTPTATLLLSKRALSLLTIFPTRHVLLTPTLTALRVWTHL